MQNLTMHINQVRASVLWFRNDNTNMWIQVEVETID